MKLRTLHLVVGVAGIAAFLGTGAYMFTSFPDLYGANEALRYMYRANHIYLLLASLANVALGLQPLSASSGWRAATMITGSVLALASPVVLCFAFVYEVPQASPERVVTALGVYALAAGVVAHAVSALRRPRHGLEGDR